MVKKISIKPKVVKFASKYGIDLANIMELAKIKAPEIVDKMRLVKPKMIDNHPQGVFDNEEEGYYCTWSITKDKKKDYIFNVNSISIDRAPSDKKAEEAIISALVS